MSDAPTSRNAPAHADQAHQAEERRRAEERSKADERRAAAHQADEKRRAEEHEAREKLIEAARKYQDARIKEDERRAALSPPERAAEDEKRAAMTPDERAKDDESKGLVAPEQLAGVTPFVAGPPSFPPLTETPHGAEFILSEANGQLSRDAGTLVDPGSVKIGQTLKITTPATLTAPAIFGPNVTTDTASDGIAIYATTTSGANLNIAVLTRNAEVNGNLLYYPGTITNADKLNIAKALAVHGIIIR
jgi:hypothetical protein